MRNQFVQEEARRFVYALTERRTPPQSCKGDTEQVKAEFAELVDVAVAAFPRGVSLDDLREKLPKAVAHIRADQDHRGWISANELQKAIRGIFVQGSDEPGGTVQKHPSRYSTELKEFATRFLARGITPPTKYWDEAFARQLLSEGRVTAQQLIKAMQPSKAQRAEMGIKGR